MELSVTGINITAKALFFAIKLARIEKLWGSRCAWAQLMGVPIVTILLAAQI